MPQKSVSYKHLEELSLFELTQALAYCEGLVSAAQNKVGHSLDMAKKALLREDLFEHEIKKMQEIHHEHNELSFAIEREIDRRMKPKLKTKYGSVTVLDWSKKMDAVYNAELEKTKDKLKEAKDKKAPMQLE